MERQPNPQGRGSLHRLAEAGLALGEVVVGLGVWRQRWLELKSRHLDAEALMWVVFTCLERHRLPERRVVVEVRSRGHPRGYWLLLAREQPEVRFTCPGLAEELEMDADLETMIRVFLGEVRLPNALLAARFGWRAMPSGCGPCRPG